MALAHRLCNFGAKLLDKWPYLHGGTWNRNNGIVVHVVSLCAKIASNMTRDARLANKVKGISPSLDYENTDFNQNILLSQR